MLRRPQDRARRLPPARRPGGGCDCRPRGWAAAGSLALRRRAGTHGRAGPAGVRAEHLRVHPGHAQSPIQATVNAIAGQQLANQFGTQRYALLFEPGTYGSAAHPLNFQVGYYTEVAGLGRNPGDVTINGSVDVYNQCACRAVASR